MFRASQLHQIHIRWIIQKFHKFSGIIISKNAADIQVTDRKLSQRFHLTIYPFGKTSLPFAYKQ